MKTFEELYEMYNNGDETIYDELDNMNFDDLYHECDKNIADYYDFKNWLENEEKYYKNDYLEYNNIKLSDMDPAYLYSLGIMTINGGENYA